MDLVAGLAKKCWVGAAETFIDHYCTTRLVKYANQKYVDRSRSLIIMYSPNWDKELKKTNHHKNKAPFRYAESMIAVVASTRAAFHLPYRQLAGMLKGMMPGHKTPDYTTMSRIMTFVSACVVHGLVLSVACMAVVFDSHAHADGMEEWINVRNETVKVFPSSVGAPLERGYLGHRFVEFETAEQGIGYAGYIEILDVYPVLDPMGFGLDISVPAPAHYAILSIPRDVLDSTYGRDAGSGAWNPYFFIVLVDDNTIISYREIHISEDRRIIFFDMDPHWTWMEIMGSCILEDCHVDLESLLHNPDLTKEEREEYREYWKTRVGYGRR